MIKGILDYRGEAEYKLLMDDDLCDFVQVEPLPIGDFNIAVNGETVCIFERKTLADLVNSFKDGRIFHQVDSLGTVCSAVQKYILIQGSL